MFRADSVNMPSPARYWLIPDTLRRATAICPDMVAVRTGLDLPIGTTAGMLPA
jgi:hypothetical protein